MTQPEPAGAGTAEEIAAQIAARCLNGMGLAGKRMPYTMAKMTAEIASALTAAESRAMGRCAKIAETYPARWEEVDPNAAVGVIRRLTSVEIAALIRSISPQGTEE